ncbi:hypothetical protein [Nocardioides jiangxiensis]|uniref:WD40-like Beta Propeller Repeat n=1 Tax=Nocardioides jiangxiensis TaxID=3064524 RepID=A0ABT9B7F6_9ACTN|nr:hypothetical protein [Nocardioides sp. WY-20]MDO7869073.1 hypothetical protein [Nocardioides sp. WY-20]
MSVRRRAAALAALVGLGLTGCSARGLGVADPVAAPRPDGAPARCHGVAYDDVRGRAADLMRPPLQEHPVQAAVCAAYWVPQVDRAFVPQALAVDGRRVFVGGYRWERAFGNRNCQVAVLDQRTGAVTAFEDRLSLPSGDYCRHGGGLELDGAGLWVLETRRLWLLDPDRIGHGGSLRQVWMLPKGVRGSTLVVDGDRIGVGGYRPHRGTRLWWFDRSETIGSATMPAPVAGMELPSRLQGLGDGPGGIWVNRSSTHCAELGTPDGRRLAFVPGSEDVELRGRDIWTVSESATQGYLDPHELVVPQVLRLDRGQVERAPRADCDF